MIYKKKSGRTDKGAFTLGWKFELLNKSNGDFTDIITLSHEQVIDVYAGTNLPDDKKNAFDVEKYLNHNLTFSKDTEFEMFRIDVTEDEIRQIEIIN